MKSFMTFNRILPALAVAGIISPFTSYVSAKTANKRPNVVLILADDLGSADVSFSRCEDFQTPNIDRIAHEGVQCTDAHISAPYSGPSRCGLNTGRYQQRFGAEMNLGNDTYDKDGKPLGVPLDEMMLSELLHKNGYTTCAVGKWHMGADKSLWPNKRGFDYFYGFSGGHFNYWGLRMNANKKTQPNRLDDYIQENGIEVPASKSTYLTDDFTDKTVDFINNNAKGDKPMYMYVAYNAPHGPYQAPKKYLDRTKHIFEPVRSVYAAMILALDDGVGRIRKALEENGVADNTIFIFLSDNGGTENAMNYPLRARKGNMFEGGTYTPFAMSWPGHIKAGSKYNEAITSLDLFPTIAAAAKINTDKQCKKPLDGVDLVPYLTGKKKGEPNHKLFWRAENGMEFAARIGDYKIVKRYYQDSLLLFNIKKDRIEQYDIAAQYPDLVNSMLKDYKAWDKQMIDDRWPDPAYKMHQLLDHNEWINYRESAAKRQLNNKAPHRF